MTAPLLISAKASAMLMVAAGINLAAVVAEVVGGPSTALQWLIACGVIFSSACSVVAVLLTHHVKVIVNSRMTEMLKITKAAGISEGALEERKLSELKGKKT